MRCGEVMPTSDQLQSSFCRLSERWIITNQTLLKKQHRGQICGLHNRAPCTRTRAFENVVDKNKAKHSSFEDISSKVSVVDGFEFFTMPLKGQRSTTILQIFFRKCGREWGCTPIICKKQCTPKICTAKGKG